MKIDNSQIFGTDGNIPKREYKSIQIEINNIKIELPKEDPITVKLLKISERVKPTINLGLKKLKNIIKNIIKKEVTHVNR